MFKSLNDILNIDFTSEISKLNSSQKSAHSLPKDKILQLAIKIILGTDKSVTKNFHNLAWIFLNDFGDIEVDELIDAKVIKELNEVNQSNLKLYFSEIPKLTHWILSRSGKKNSNGMAIKQHLIESAPPETPIYDLEKITQMLEMIQADNSFNIDEHLIGHTCEELVRYLGKVPLSSAPRETTFKEAKGDIKKISELYKSISYSKSYTVQDTIITKSFAALYKMITKEEKVSPYAGIVLNLYDKSMIKGAVQNMLKMPQVTDEAIMKALIVLFDWFRMFEIAPTLNVWITEILLALTDQNKQDIIKEISLKSVVTICTLCNIPIFRENAMSILLCLLRINRSPEVFHACIKSGKSLTNLLRSSSRQAQDEKSETAMFQSLIDTLSFLINMFPGYDDLYAELNKLLDQFEKSPSFNLPWIDNGIVSQVCSSNPRAGLVNLGNTCYMNSVLQALVMTKQFSREILLSNNNEELFINIQKLLALLLHSIRPELTPRAVLASAKPPDFVNGVQQDSSEFLSYLLDKLHEQEKKLLINKISEKMPSPVKRIWPTEDNLSMANTEMVPQNIQIPETLIQRTFDGKLMISYQCLVCRTKSSNTDSFRDLQLSFPDCQQSSQPGQSIDPNYSVQKLLDIYCSPEKLEGDNQYFCDKCGKLCDGERSISIVQPPKNLILTLKHFRYDQRHHIRAKLMNKVYHDEEISLKIYTPSDIGQLITLKYILFAAIVHSGYSLDSGHYYTYAADHPDCWYKFNDNFVTKCSIQELHNLPNSNTPYILFYHQHGDHDPKINPMIEVDVDMEVDEMPHCDNNLVHLSTLNSLEFPKFDDLPHHLRDFVFNDNRDYQDQIKSKAARKQFGNINKFQLPPNKNQDSDSDEPPPNNCGGNSLENRVNRFIF